MVRDKIKITMDEMEQATYVGVRRSMTAIFSSGLVVIFKVSTIKIFLAIVCKVIVESGKSIPDTELHLTFVKSKHLIGRYIPTISDIDL